MKIQIDTTAKIVKVEESVNLGRFVEAIKNMLPDWKSYALESGSITYWIDPYPVTPYTPWWKQYPYPWITYTTGDDAVLYNSQAGDVSVGIIAGTYCVEVK